MPRWVGGGGVGGGGWGGGGGGGGGGEQKKGVIQDRNGEPDGGLKKPSGPVSRREKK